MPRLSIIIPALGSIQSLESTLISVLENRPKDCEVIVPLNTVYDDPYRLEGEVRFVEAHEDSGFTACANRGIVQSRAALVHVISPGCEVTEGWAEASLRHFGNPRVAAVAPLVLDATQRERVLSAGVKYLIGGRRVMAVPLLVDAVDRGAAPVLGPCGFAAFYRKSALERVSGGSQPSVGDTLSDVDLALALQQAGFLAVFEPNSRVYALLDPVSTEGAFRSGLHAERLFWSHGPHAGWFKSLLAHPWTVAVETAGYLPHPRAIAHFLGRMVACCQISRYREHHQRLAQLREQIAILPLGNTRRAGAVARADRPRQKAG